VQKRILFTVSVLFTFYFINSGCSKLDTTDIGADLLPAIDNVNTFETFLDINTTQGIFNDTSIVFRTEDHALGKINNDPLFGTTQANIYAQFKPTFFPFYYGSFNDTNNIVGFDSVVLCLSYKDAWGDTTMPLKIDVNEIAKPLTGAFTTWDTVSRDFNVNFAPPVGSLLGSTIVDLKKVRNYVVYVNRKDSMRNHIRIKFSNTSFVNSLFALDTLVTGNNVFRTDSAFKVFNKGLAIRATGVGECLMYTNLTDTSSRLEVHYRRKKGSSTTIDTMFSSLRMLSLGGPGTTSSATANNIIRNRAGSEMGTTNTQALYLQTSPGSYAELDIKPLDTLSNRIVHRAEIIMEQIPSSNFMLDSLLAVPDFLYLDIIDSVTGGNIATKWKPIYFDLNPSVAYDPDGIFTPTFYPGQAGIDYFYHGGYARNKMVLNQNVKFYNFNITRYVQQIVNKQKKNYKLRLSAPYKFSYPQYSQVSLSGNNPIGAGRVKLGSGTNTNYRMRLRIVYSKI
jgi:hypothetical protein